MGVRFPSNFADPISAQARSPQNIVLSPGVWPTNRVLANSLSNVTIEGAGATLAAAHSLTAPLLQFPSAAGPTFRANNANLPNWASRIQIEPVTTRSQSTLVLAGEPAEVPTGWYIITSSRIVTNAIGTFNVCRELCYIVSAGGDVSEVTVTHVSDYVTGEPGFGSIYDDEDVFLVPVTTVIQNLTVRNLTLKGQWNALQSPYHAQLLNGAFCSDVTFENVTFDGFDAEGCTWVLSRNIRYLGCAWDNSTGVVGGAGYAGAHYGCHNVELVDPYFANGIRRCPYFAYGIGSYKFTGTPRSFNLNHGDPDYSGPGSCVDVDHGLGRAHKVQVSGWRHEGTGGGFAAGNGTHRESSQDALTVDDCDFGRGDCYIQDDSSGGVISNSNFGRLFISGHLFDAGRVPTGPTAPSDFEFDTCTFGSLRTTDFGSGVAADQRLAGTWDFTDCVIDARFFEALPIDIRCSSDVTINFTRCTFISGVANNRGAVIVGLNDGSTDAVITINCVDCVGYRDVAADSRAFFDLQGTAGVLNLTNFTYHRAGTGVAVLNAGGTPWTVNETNTTLGTEEAPEEDA